MDQCAIGILGSLGAAAWFWWLYAANNDRANKAEKANAQLRIDYQALRERVAELESFGRRL